MSKMWAAYNGRYANQAHCLTVTDAGEMQTNPTWHMLPLSRSCCFASLGLGCQSLLGLMWHDSSSIVVACKATPDPWSRVSKRLPAHVLDALREVTLMPLLTVPAPFTSDQLRRSPPLMVAGKQKRVQITDRCTSCSRAKG